MRITLVKLELQEQNNLLRRIAEALERAYPPIPERKPLDRLSDERDLLHVDHEELLELAEIKRQLALGWKVLVDSPAYEERVKEYEADVMKERGQDGVDDLPWNRSGKRR